MIFLLVARVWSVVLHPVLMARHNDRDKVIEILLLRQQIRILQRKYPQTPRLSRGEKLALIVLASKLTGLTTRARARLSAVVLLFKPDITSDAVATKDGEGRPG